ncbi:MAG TPA: 50S ribosomal protein L10 [Rhodospirillales bacterium]|nr:MAG: 50S ribosomal protein L10 [Alphaproteobacteria bacterium MarineAlpha3_Bin6]HIA82718.1 50S ribosomal protein L10 [Rhodospirillales bacterium]HIN75293.1 50S ribosomal protein L10 [Rhodospirillales bacterium]
MDRRGKEEWIASLKQVFKEAALIVVTHYHGLTVAQMTDLRSQMRASGARFKVTKNRLTRLALDGTKVQDLSTLFNGPTAIAYSSDPVAAAKVAVKFAKENENLVVLGGSFNGQILDVDAVATLAKLPSLDELRGKVLALINTPATRITGILQAPAAQVARVISAHAASEKAA